MNATLVISDPPTSRTLRALRPRGGAWPWGLAAVAVVAFVLTSWQVWEGTPSDYYASIAISMSQSWSNFFFGSMDPAGTVTLDKIPGSFWVPALFVKVFGYSAWAVILPNSLAAVGSALITAVAARRLAGVRAGLWAGAIVATTPILVAVSRSNQPEAFFVLGLSITAWAAVRAVQARSVGWLVVAGAAIGLSFQFYMLEAWAVWPALAVAYLCTAQSWARRVGHLLVAGAVSAVASLWWVAIVSLIPASSRPYIGSTLGNDPWEMVFGYNGFGRFSATKDASSYLSFAPAFSGDPGVLRLFNAQLAGQIAWLIPAALIALVVLWILRFPRPLTVLLTVWTLTFAAMFSVVDGMHQFYTAALAVPLGLAVATAVVWSARRAAVWPVVTIVAVTAVTAVGIGFSVGGYSVPVALGQSAVAVVAIVLLVLRRHRGRPVTAAATIVGMLLTPAVWSAVTIAHPASINPVAGGVPEMGDSLAALANMTGYAAIDGTDPAAAGGAPGNLPAGAEGLAGIPGGASSSGVPASGGGGAAGGEPPADGDLISWLRERRGSAKYLAATFGVSAASMIVESRGESFLPIGGFSDTDAVPSLAQFVSMVQRGEVRYVVRRETVIVGPGAELVEADLNTEETVQGQIQSWVDQNCTLAPDAPSPVSDCG